MIETYTAQTTDPIAHALTHLASADDHGDSARDARALADDMIRTSRAAEGSEAHRLAGRFREQERAALKRAEVLAAIAQAQALASIADSLSRIALAR